MNPGLSGEWTLCFILPAELLACLPGTVFAHDGRLARAGIWVIPSRQVVGFGQNSYF